MKLHDLAPAPGSKRTSRRIGRGHGSGRVKTSGYGTKGQNARAGRGSRPFFEGGQNPWTMRIPHKRGFSRARFRVDAQVVNLRDLERAFTTDETVTLALLEERGLVGDGSGKAPVKVLGDGSLTKPLRLEVHRASASARRAIEGAGGALTLLPDRWRSRLSRKKEREAAQQAGEGAAGPAEEARGTGASAGGIGTSSSVSSESGGAS